ncbi:MAG: Sec-independent protein translocase protein TatB [Neisseria sp.]|nr:Sec-independent protein translocase protein TatB [Neisseria sp.]
MFDLGFGEIVLILIVALVVLGPERLPKVARSLGNMLGKVRTFVGTVKSDIAAQMDEHELRDLGNSLRESTAALRREMEGSLSTLEQQVNEMRSDLGSTAWQRLPEMRTPEDFAADMPTYTAPKRSLLNQSRQRHKNQARKIPSRPRLRARTHSPRQSS